MSTSQDPTARLRAGLNPLLTASLGVFHNQNSNSTPLSGVSMSSHNPFSATHTPVSAMQPYNPQEWVASPASGPERPQQFQESQTSPPPPPPYSPPRSQRPASIAFDSSQAAHIAAAAMGATPPLSLQRISPDRAPAATSFPPPPGGRGGSRDRRFGLPSLGRRRDADQASTPVEVHSPHPLAASSRPVLHVPHPQSQPRAGPLSLQIPAHRTELDMSNLAPGARRAVSTPAAVSPASARSRSSSQVRWDPGMPVPPPPPGPPPSSSRSQSASHRPDYGNDPVTSPPTRRPPPSGVTALGPVPPTPANWTENNNSPSRGQSPDRTPVVETPATSSSTAYLDSGPSSAGSSGLVRTHAVRGEKTLRERRNESRTRGVRDSIDGSISTQPLSDIVIPGETHLSRRLTINRGQRSGGRTADTPGTSGTNSSSDYDIDSKGSTPRASGHETSTPPFSPRPRKSSNPFDNHHHIAPKSLPTPPPQSRSSSQAEMRQTSDALVPTPLSPGRALTKQVVVSQTVDQFTRGTIERFKAFAHDEAAAQDDVERVRLFADFFVSESRMRRERYSSAIGAMGSEILDLTRDLFRPMPATRRESTNSATSGVELTPQSSEPRSHRGSIGSSVGANTPGGQTNPTPTSTGLPGSSPVTGPVNANWQTSNYMPSLSPILSMSVSDAVDEQDSRGRPPSRWWEADSLGAPSTRIERSKRESKYMSVPKEAREALQWGDNPSSAPGSSTRNSDEYPAEKTGLHDVGVGTPQANHRNSIQSVSTPNTPTPNPAHLDVSRLVTLPPPYPRHHPAVNNNHPDLANLRNSVRTLSDMTELEAIKARFEESSTKARSEAAEEAKKQLQELRTNLQQEIASGNIGYGEAAAIEADMKVGEDNKTKDLEKQDFEAFQALVVVPLNDLLTSRIEKASTMFDELRSRLFVETAESNPNLPQEEGDEQPELLEKLTLLKWIFEARELLHKGVYDLLTDRNDRYCELVCMPYRLANSDEKLASAKAFFAEDGRNRATAYFQEVFRRTQEFRNVIEENVLRGVEVQLSAFWDIAPPLKRVLDKIPLDMAGFETQIPATEFEDNPSYVDHPLQYLFSLLLHAEKSTYQFMESQTNLLCLLHEVKEAVITAKSKVYESEQRDAARVEAMKREEMGKLTDDLKEKVRVVQDQWKSALGECVGGVKERVGGWLLETGGWDESLEDGGVGSL